MTKSELIERLALKQTHLMHKDVELAVKLVHDQISDALAKRDRVEIRGFGSFSLHFRPSRVGRNPKTGDSVEIPAKYVPHLIDDNSGVGTQVMATDINVDKKLDVVVGNKRGAFVHIRK